MANDLDAHAKPPAKMREVYKEYQKLKTACLDDYPGLIQFDGSVPLSEGTVTPANIAELPHELRQVLSDFLEGDQRDLDLGSDHHHVYEVPNMPGLLIYPSILPPPVQLSLLDKLLHRDISNSEHLTNVHLHHEVPYPRPSRDSYFSPSSSNLTFPPKDPSVHKPITTSKFLNKKLRWCTLGGQYDWTAKVYPSAPPPAFPADTKALIQGIFPMKAEAAIVNLYSPGDTLSLHRDVSEECAAPLVSISLGCDAVFICGLEGAGDGDEPRVATMRLRSGDAVLMSRESRYAWHGVPKVVEQSCPEWMEDWPAGKEAGGFGQWRGWMKGKRVNLNVRQMFA